MNVVFFMVRTAIVNDEDDGGDVEATSADRGGDHDGSDAFFEVDDGEFSVGGVLAAVEDEGKVAEFE